MTTQPNPPEDIGAVDPDDPSDDIELLPAPDELVGDPEGVDPVDG